MTRRPFLFACALAFVLAAAPVFAQAGTWQIDSAHTSAQFAVKHMMVSTVRGQFNKTSGTVAWDGKDFTTAAVDVVIDAASINTRESRRDDHLRSADFFDVARHPTLTFASKKVEKVGDGQYKVTGDLTLRGVTKEVVLAVEGSPTPMQDPFGNTKLGGSATTRLNRKDFGLNWSKSLDGGGVVLGDEVEVTIDIELIKK